MQIIHNHQSPCFSAFINRRTNRDDWHLTDQYIWKQVADNKLPISMKEGMANGGYPRLYKGHSVKELTTDFVDGVVCQWQDAKRLLVGAKTVKGAKKASKHPFFDEQFMLLTPAEGKNKVRFQSVPFKLLRWNHRFAPKNLKVLGRQRQKNYSSRTLLKAIEPDVLVEEKTEVARGIDKDKKPWVLIRTTLQNHKKAK